EFEDAAWSSAYGIATPQQAALLDADPGAWRVTLERLVDRTDDLLHERGAAEDNGDGDGTRAQLAEVRDRLRAALEGMDTSPRPHPAPEARAAEPVAEDEGPRRGGAAGDVVVGPAGR